MSGTGKLGGYSPTDEQIKVSWPKGRLHQVVENRVNGSVLMVSYLPYAVGKQPSNPYLHGKMENLLLVNKSLFGGVSEWHRILYYFTARMRLIIIDYET